jgi:hypothetical protein
MPCGGIRIPARPATASETAASVRRQRAICREFASAKECPVCLTEWAHTPSGRRVMNTTCCHTACQACYSRWLAASGNAVGTCMICRR